MFEIILEIIISLILDVIFEFFFEVMIFFGYESIASSLKEGKSVNKYLAFLGCLLIGSIIGLLSYFIYPKHIFNNNPMPGISLLLSPILVGILMMRYGEMRSENNKRVSILTTFWGGAIFAFAFAIVRFLMFG